jgi:hypothetical protein
MKVTLIFHFHSLIVVAILRNSIEEQGKESERSLQSLKEKNERMQQIKKLYESENVQKEKDEQLRQNDFQKQGIPK